MEIRILKQKKRPNFVYSLPPPYSTGMYKSCKLDLENAQLNNNMKLLFRSLQIDRF